MDLIDQMLPVIQAKERDLGYDALSHGERVVLDVNAIEADVNDGGFHQFFFNSASDRVLSSIVALREIGANNAAALVEEACARFPGGRPSADRKSRQKQLNAVGLEAFHDLDQRFYAYPDPIAKLLISFLQRQSH